MHEFTGGRGADVVFDGAGGRLGAAAFEVTAAGGRFSAHGVSDGGFAAFEAEEAARRGITVQGIPQPGPADLRRLAARALADAAAGRIRPVIGQTFPLERAAAAHAALAARTAVAKTLLLTRAVAGRPPADNSVAGGRSRGRLSTHVRPNPAADLG